MSELNRAWWDERVPIDVASEFYDVEGFRAGGSSLRPFEVEEVGDVADRSLLHLQCHFGLDTLSWARRGARVSGLDFSQPAIEAARALAADTGLDAEFSVADVYDAPAVLGGRRFDVVYTGIGAINWLPDMERWARVVAELLEPWWLPLPERVPPVHLGLRRRRATLPRSAKQQDIHRKLPLRARLQAAPTMVLTRCRRFTVSGSMPLSKLI